jgi:hypothetical protein
MLLTRLTVCRFAAFLFAVALAGQAAAQSVSAPQEPPPSVTVATQTELNLIDLPTTMSLKRHRSYFRLTHRFARDLRRGDLGELASDLFSLDNGAVIGFEYRFGITSTIQAGAHRSMLSKTIQTFARWDALAQGDRFPVSASLTLSLEGLNNLRQNRQPAVAITVSRVLGDRAAFYMTPAFVGRTQAVDFIEGHDHDHDLGEVDEHANHNDTWMLGFGGRVRFSDNGFLVGEYTPRLAGYDPNKGTWGVGIERRTGGHVLQLNLTNSFGTTFGQLARGGSPHDVYLGFNITRRF